MTFEERIAKLFREFPTEVYEPDEIAIAFSKTPWRLKSFGRPIVPLSITEQLLNRLVQNLS